MHTPITPIIGSRAKPASHPSPAQTVPDIARFGAGYDVNPYLAIEAGYLYLPKIMFNNINNSKTDAGFREQIVDLVAKVSLPVWPKNSACLSNQASPICIVKKLLSPSTTPYSIANQMAEPTSPP